MSTETHEKAFWEEKNLSFKTATPEDDLLHRQCKDANRSPNLTETQFFGFSVPGFSIAVAPPPPPVAYYPAPAYGYYAPGPVYVQPAPIYVRSYYRGGHWDHGHHWGGWHHR